VPSRKGTPLQADFGDTFSRLDAQHEMTVRARMPMPAPMFAHGEQVFVKFPLEHLFEVGA
jgi:hypothetical protein